MRVMTTLEIVFLLALCRCTLVTSSRCDSVNITCSANFILHSDIQLVGCFLVTPSAFVRSRIPLDCLYDDRCTGLVCDRSMTSCSPCRGDLVSGLSFTSSSVYLKRRYFRSFLNYDPQTLVADETVDIPDGLWPGDVIYMKATVLKYDNFLMNLMVDNSTVNYHVRARCGGTCSDTFDCGAAPGDCSSKYLTVSYFVNGNWAANTLTSYAYPFLVNSTFEVYFLVQINSVTCYINQMFLLTYSTPLTSDRVRSLQVKGNLFVHEVSV